MADSLGTLVEKATSEYLIQTDWAINMQICDSLNNDPSGAKEVVKQIAKRLKETKKDRVPLFALELLETLMNNCECVHAQVGGKEFQAELIKLIQNKKTKDQVRNMALDLVQYWADSFQQRRDLPLFNQTNMLLRKTGIPFPPRRKDVPPLTFKSRAAPAPSTPSSVPPSAPAFPAAEPPKQFSSLQEGANLALEMLTYTNVEEDDPANNEILKDLVNTCKEGAPSVRSAIETGNFSSDEQMMALLALNDELVKVQELFQDLVVRRVQFVETGGLSRHYSHSHGAIHKDTLDLTGGHVDNNNQGHAAGTSANLLDMDFFGPSAAQPQPHVIPQPVQSQSTLSQPHSTYAQPQPMYSQPQPTYSQPQPTYSQPQPTYSQPQPAYSQPQPAYPQPVFQQQPTPQVIPQLAPPPQTIQPPKPVTPTANTNPFFGAAGAPLATATKPAASHSDFDDFDALVNSRHPSSGASTLPVPVQPFTQPLPSSSSSSLYPAPTAHPPLTTNLSTNIFPAPTLASTNPGVLLPSSGSSTLTPSAAYHTAPLTPTVLAPTASANLSGSGSSSTLSPTSSAAASVRPPFPAAVPGNYAPNSYPASGSYPISVPPAGYASGYPAAPYGSAYPPYPGAYPPSANAAPFLSTSPTAAQGYAAPGYGQPGYAPPPLNPPSYAQLSHGTASYRPQ